MLKVCAKTVYTAWLFCWYAMGNVPQLARSYGTLAQDGVKKDVLVPFFTETFTQVFPLKNSLISICYGRVIRTFHIAYYNYDKFKKIRKVI